MTDVEVTLTEQTQFQDPQTKQFDKETKALLNVSPRNVFQAWQSDSMVIMDRVQPYNMCGTTACPQLPLSIISLAP